MTNDKHQMTNALTPSPSPIGRGGMALLSPFMKKLGEGFCALIFALLVFQSSLFAFPDKIFLNIPFAPQAPFGKWTPLYNEACEEASIAMVMRYVQHKGLTRTEMDKEINKMVDFQIKKYGGHFDLTAKQTAQLMEDFYGFDKFQVVEDASVETIVSALANKYPVIAPMAGRLLGNPYYRNPGPIYHMLVFKGYDLGRKEFIVNDPGTKRGLNYRYKFSAIEKAWSDWKSGKHSLIVVKVRQ